jgi:putative FmdB family regulatory protein
MRYDFFCEGCNKEVEIVKGMNDPSPEHCPECGSKRWHRVFGSAVAVHPPADAGWESKNNGLGEFMPQLGTRYLDPFTKTQPNPNAYARSRAEAIEKFKRRGYTDIQKD